VEKSEALRSKMRGFCLTAVLRGGEQTGHYPTMGEMMHLCHIIDILAITLAYSTSAQHPKPFDFISILIHNFIKI
jgi:hypothetical protein